MERELILSLKNKWSDKKRVNAEIEHIKKMLPYIESYEAFSQNNEVFDISRRKKITGHTKLMNMFEEGIDKNAFYFVLSRN